MPTLPDLSFAEIAVRLVHYAESAKRAAYDGNMILMRSDPQPGPGVPHWLHELLVAADMADKLQVFFREAIPHEEQFRDFVAGLNAAVEADKTRRATA